jgi:GH15 family glucan-1,4-alpha-glucosidase
LIDDEDDERHHDAVTGASVPQDVRPRRQDGYLPLRSYAVIGDGRTVALVGDDGAIDWLAWPDLDSASVFAALLDAEHGGRCSVRPADSFSTARRYLPGTNVLETTFTTWTGVVRVLDVMTLRGHGLGPSRELQRRVEAVSGEVPMVWEVRPRFADGRRHTRISWRSGVPVATCGADAIAVRLSNAGDPAVDAERISGSFGAVPGSPAVIALCASHQEPLVFPTDREMEARFAATIASWGKWSSALVYQGPWRQAVERSALILKLLIFAPSGAVAAAATTSLPEHIGGERNWDYRFCWIRDAAFTMAALLRLGRTPEATAYFWWLIHATQLSHPRVRPLYRLDGGTRTVERTLPMPGYRDSRPVRIGNAAAEQLQLDSYGELLATVWLFVRTGGHLDPEIGRRIAETADLVGKLWQQPDAGIWEVRSAPAHFTHSKMMCWVALDRAARLADEGLLPTRHQKIWREQARACQAFIEEQCFSPALGSYTRSAGSEELDASVLLGLLSGYGESHSDRWQTTVTAVRRVLGRGPHLLRYTGDDGLSGTEGAFVSCAFWLVEALARTGQVEDATALMDELVGLANDVGLFAEEIDPATGAFLGNLPQGLSHLALISAATAIADARPR